MWWDLISVTRTNALTENPDRELAFYLDKDRLWTDHRCGVLEVVRWASRRNPNTTAVSDEILSLGESATVQRRFDNPQPQQ